MDYKNLNKITFRDRLLRIALWIIARNRVSQREGYDRIVAPKYLDNLIWNVIRRGGVEPFLQNGTNTSKFKDVETNGIKISIYGDCTVLSSISVGDERVIVSKTTASLISWKVHRCLEGIKLEESMKEYEKEQERSYKVAQEITTKMIDKSGL